MLPRSIAELNQIREECKAMVTKRAAASGAVALVPIPGTDIAADIGMLMELLPSINQRFGLSKEQVDQLDERTKILVMQIAKAAGAQLVGQVITKQLIMEIVKKVAGRFAAKQVVKYIPIAGQITAAAIAFAAMKYVGNSHVDQCYEVVKKVLENQQATAWEDVAATTTAEQPPVSEGSAPASSQNIIDTIKQVKELYDAGFIEKEEFEQTKKELLARLYAGPQKD